MTADPVAPAKGSMPERPPRRPPIRYLPLTPGRKFGRSAFQMIAVIVFAFLLNITVLSHLQHAVAQHLLFMELRDQLTEGTLPVSEGDLDDVLLRDGAPVALLEIPQIGVHEVIVEGSDSATLMDGPGHRRDTVLPGQAGVSVVLGREAAYGGPFSRIQELPPGAEFTVITGQGEQTFRVIGVRYAGDPTPPAITAGQSRLVLQSARPPAYIPSAIVYLDAELIGDVQDRGARQTTWASLPEEDLPLAGDTSSLWALVFALQFLVAVELVALYVTPRIGRRKAWIVFAPLSIIGGLWVATQIALVLPNLL